MYAMFINESRQLDVKIEIYKKMVMRDVEE